MKKGDLVAKEVTLKEGEIVYHNCSSMENARSFMETDFLGEYGIIPAWELIPDEINPTCSAVILRSPVTKRLEAIVNWVIENEVALKFKDGHYDIIDLNEETSKDWVVIQEGVPSYQSSVENLTDDQLREAIEALKNHRDSLPKPKTRKALAEKVDKSDPMAVALAALPDDKKLELMRKLGMVD